MIQGHNDHITFLCQISSVIRRQFLSRTGRVSTPMQPHHYRTLLAVIDSRSPYICAQAILARITVIPIECESYFIIYPSGTFPLGTSRAIGTATTDTLPFIRSNRCHESFGLGIRNTFININAIFQITGNLPRFQINNSSVCRCNNFTT